MDATVAGGARATGSDGAPAGSAAGMPGGYALAEHGGNLVLSFRGTLLFAVRIPAESAAGSSWGQTVSGALREAARLHDAVRAAGRRGASALLRSRRRAYEEAIRLSMDAAAPPPVGLSVGGAAVNAPVGIPVGPRDARRRAS